jgi:PAS domain S-box-containing protein
MLPSLPARLSKLAPRIQSKLVHRWGSSPAYISDICSLIAVLVGVMVLVGWAADIATLKSLSPHWVSMKANTALGFVLAGSALFLSSGERRRDRTGRLGILLAVLVSLLGLLTAGEYLLGWNLGIDQLLTHEPPGTVGALKPGRMAPSAALSFATLGIALVLLHAARRRRLIQILVAPSLTLSTLAVLTYILGAATLYGTPGHAGMALHTALAFLVLGVGVGFAVPENGFMAILTSKTFTGATTRRLLPLSLLVVVALGWVGEQGEHQALYRSEFGVVFLVFAAVLVIMGIVWWGMTSLARMETNRSIVEASLRESEVRTRLIIDTALDAIVTMDDAGLVTDWNPRAEALLGWARDEALGRPLVSMIVPPHLHEEYRHDQHDFLNTGTAVVAGHCVERPILHRDGHEIPMEIAVSPARVGNSFIFSVFMRDIRARKAA